jgi:hypothetical protein
MCKMQSLQNNGYNLTSLGAEWDRHGIFATDSGIAVTWIKSSFWSFILPVELS